MEYYIVQGDSYAFVLTAPSGDADNKVTTLANTGGGYQGMWSLGSIWGLV